MAADREPGAEPLRQLGGSGLGHDQAGAARQRGDQLGEIQRVARRAAGEPQQLVAGLAAGQGGDQLGHGRLGEPGELEPYRIVRRPP